MCKQRTLPSDVVQRLADLSNLPEQMPISFEPVEQGLAEYVNHYSEDWVEVFLLFNNEEGIHHFFQTGAA